MKGYCKLCGGRFRHKAACKIRILADALRYYAGRLRADGNGYEFDEEKEELRETYNGEKARAALRRVGCIR